MSGHYKRKRYFIDKRLQGVFALRLYLVLIVSAVAVTLLMSAFTSDSFTLLYTDNELQLDHTPLLILKRLLLANWIIIAPVGIIIAVVAILVSHRLAGPIHKLDTILDAMNRGVIGQVFNFRRKDNFQNVADKLSQFNTTLAGNVKKLKSISERLQLVADNAAQAPEARLGEVQRLSHELNAIADFYTVADE